MSLPDFTNPKVRFSASCAAEELFSLSLFQRLCSYDPAALKLSGEMLLLWATIFSHKVLDSLETGEYIFRLTCECWGNRKELRLGIHPQT
jgi:hypothetical protein